MTYTPPPYQPPQGPFGYQPQPAYGDPLAPARRAAIMCWVLGGIGLLCGVCLSGVAFLAPLESLEPQMRASIPPEQLQALGNMDLIHLFRIIYGATGIVTLLLSVLFLILGGFVRKGGKGAVITGLVLFIAAGLFCGLVILVGVVQAVTSTPAALIGVLIWLAIAAAVGLTILWLSQALRSSSHVSQQQRMQAHYWQMQQQQAFQPPQSGHGYGYGYGLPQQQPGTPEQSPGPVPPPPGSQGPQAPPNQ